jgi:hypothetical protein
MSTWDEAFADRYDEWSAHMTADITFYARPRVRRHKQASSPYNEHPLIGRRGRPDSLVGGARRGERVGEGTVHQDAQSLGRDVMDFELWFLVCVAR